MQKSKKSIIWLVITIILAIIQAMINYKLLPAQVEIHYKFYISPELLDKFYFSIYPVIIIISLSVFFFFLSRSLYKIPDFFLNLPYKNYWLNSERKTSSIDKLSHELIKIAVLSNFLIIIINQMMVNDMTSDGFKLMGVSWWILFLFFGIVTIDVIKIYKYFNSPLY